MTKGIGKVLSINASACEHFTARHTSTLKIRHLGLAKIRQDRVDELKGLVDLLTDLSTSEHNLATDEDEQDNLGLHHAVDKTREQLRLVGRESVMARCKTLQANGELDVA